MWSYTCNNKTFDFKFLAIDEHLKTKQPIHFHAPKEYNTFDFSIEPKELKDLVSQTKTAWESVGTVNYEIKPSEKSSASSRRSIYVTENLKSGEVLTVKNIRRIRPGKGLAPKFFQRVLKKKVNKDIKKGSPLKWEDVDFK